MIKQCLITYISNIKSGYNVLRLGLTLTVPDLVLANKTHKNPNFNSANVF